MKRGWEERTWTPRGCFWMGEQFQRVNALQVTDRQAIKGHSAAQTEKRYLVE